jgi:hypothetical protein
LYPRHPFVVAPSNRSRHPADCSAGVRILVDAAVDAAGAAPALLADELPLPFVEHAVMTVIEATRSGATYRVGET